jgi:hypothetical protein
MNEHYLNLFLGDIFQFGSGWVLFLCRKDESNMKQLYKSYKGSLKYLVKITADVVNMDTNDENTLYKYTDNMIDIIYSTISKGFKNGSIKYPNIDRFINPMINILHKYNFGCDNGIIYTTIPVIILNLYDIANFYIKYGCNPSQDQDSPKKNFDKIKQCYIDAYMQHSKNIDTNESESHKEKNKATNIIDYIFIGLLVIILIFTGLYIKYKK